jgi:hypothetical protein
METNAISGHEQRLGFIGGKLSNLSALGSLLGLDGGLLTHGGKDDNVGVLLIDLEELVDLVANLAVGHANIILEHAVLVHEVEETIVGDVEQLVLAAGDVGDVHVVGRGGEIFVLLGGEDVDGDKVDLGVTVLAGLGGGHVDNLAGAALDDDETVLAEGRALHGEGQRRAGIGGIEGDIVLLSHDDGLRKVTGSSLEGEESEVMVCTGERVLRVGWRGGEEGEKRKGRVETLEEGRDTNGGGGGRKKGCEVLIFFFSPV